MYGENECVFYYVSVYNEPFEMPAMPEGHEQGILSGMYKVSSTDGGDGQKCRPQLFGSGPILRDVLSAQQTLKDKYEIGSDVWSVTSYSELAREAGDVSRWNRLHPDEEPRVSYLERCLAGVPGPFISASDNVRLVADQIRQWVPGDYVVLGTDGFGRSDTRENLRRHFEIDAASTVYAVLESLSHGCEFPKERLPYVLRELGTRPGSGGFKNGVRGATSTRATIASVETTVQWCGRLFDFHYVGQDSSSVPAE